MTTTLTAEKLAQRAVDVNVLTEQDLNGVWAEFGTRAVDYEPFKQTLVRRGLLTNYQLDRLIEGYRNGFFYGDYKILYGVGAGTFARVFRATHIHTGELFAVKVLAQPLQPRRRRRQTRPLPSRRGTRRPAEAPQHRRHPRGRLERRRQLHRDGLRRGAEPPRLLQSPRQVRTAPRHPHRRRHDGGAQLRVPQGDHAPRPEDVERHRRQRRRREDPRLRPRRHGRRRSRRSESPHHRLRRSRTGDQRPQGRHPQRYLFLRLHLLPDAQRQAGPRRNARTLAAAQQVALHGHQAAARRRPRRAAAALARIVTKSLELDPAPPLPDAGRNARRPQGRRQAASPRRRTIPRSWKSKPNSKAKTTPASRAS